MRRTRVTSITLLSAIASTVLVAGGQALADGGAGGSGPAGTGGAGGADSAAGVGATGGASSLARSGTTGGGAGAGGRRRHGGRWR